MATNTRNRHLEPCYKLRTAVNDKVGVILDVEVTTGEKNEGQMLEPQVGSTSRRVPPTRTISVAQGRGAVDRNRAEPPAARQVPLPYPNAGRSCLPGVTAASGVNNDVLILKLPKREDRTKPAFDPQTGSLPLARRPLERDALGHRAELENSRACADRNTRGETGRCITRRSAGTQISMQIGRISAGRAKRRHLVILTLLKLPAG